MKWFNNKKKKKSQNLNKRLKYTQIAHPGDRTHFSLA